MPFKMQRLDKPVQAERYDATRQEKVIAGHYERSFSTQAGDVTLKVPKLKGLTFESAYYSTATKGVGMFLCEEAPEMYLSVLLCAVESITDSVGSEGIAWYY